VFNPRGKCQKDERNRAIDARIYLGKLIDVFGPDKGYPHPDMGTGPQRDGLADGWVLQGTCMTVNSVVTGNQLYWAGSSWTNRKHCRGGNRCLHSCKKLKINPLQSNLAYRDLGMFGILAALLLEKRWTEDYCYFWTILVLFITTRGINMSRGCCLQRFQ